MGTAATTSAPPSPPAALRPGPGLRAPEGARSALLLCGALSSVLYVAADVAAALSWEAYRYADQAVSELGAVGAPTRPFLLVAFLAYDLLAAAFAIGLVRGSGGRRGLRRAGWALLLFAAVGLLGVLFFPMTPRGGEHLFTDTMHIAVTAVGVLCFLVAAGLAAAALGTRFRLYTIATVAATLAFGAWTSVDAPRIEQGIETPWLGLKERACVYAMMLWVLVLAVALWREGRGRRPTSPGVTAG